MNLYFSILLIFITGLCFGQTLPQIDLLIENEIKSDKVAAIAVAVIDSGKVVHLSAAGYRDLEIEHKATINTPFHIASVSKTVTNLAVFKLVELEKIDLNTDINEYLPFEVKNPYYPNDIITIKRLLNHRSGIKDDFLFYRHYWSKPKGDPTLELGQFLKDYLDVNGKNYKKKHFESKSDYQSFSYSNTGVALLGFIVEHISGMTYEEFCQQNIFEPLGMINSSWFLKNLDVNQVAKTYVYRFYRGLIFKGHNGYPDYPAGQLRTSISDYSKLVVAYLNSENSKFVLKKETTLRITPESLEGYFTWFKIEINNHLYYTHGGADTGVKTIVIMDVTQKRAIIIFANSKFNNQELYKSIEIEMWSK